MKKINEHFTYTLEVTDKELEFIQLAIREARDTRMNNPKADTIYKKLSCLHDDIGEIVWSDPA